jgi:hypothetical protein
MMRETAIAVLAAGADLRIDSGMRETMLAIAEAARKSRRHVTFVGSPMRETMVAVGEVAPGYVTFDTAGQK